MDTKRGTSGLNDGRHPGGVPPKKATWMRVQWAGGTKSSGSGTLSQNSNQEYGSGKRDRRDIG